MAKTAINCIKMQQLYDAIKIGNINDIKEMLSNLNGIDLNARHSNNGNTPLIFAIDNDNIEAAMLLLDAGADPDIQNDDNHSALHWAAAKSSQEDTRLIEMVLKKTNAINAQDIEGDTALCLAIMSKNKKVIQLLLDAGADPNIQNNYGDTVLIKAAKENKYEVVRILIEHKANVNIQDHSGRTALYWAVIKDNQSIIAELLNAGANPDIKDTEGKTVLNNVDWNLSFFILKIIFSKIIDINTNEEEDAEIISILGDWESKKSSYQFHTDENINYIELQ